jgi:hypothetical protein
VVDVYRGRFEEEQDRYGWQQKADRQVEEAFAGRLADPNPAFQRPDVEAARPLSEDAGPREVAEEQARLEQVRKDWQQDVKSRFDERWQAAFDEYRRGEITRSDFAESFDRLSAGLHDEFELSAAAHLARRSAEDVFDSESADGRSALSPEELQQARREFVAEAVGEVHRAAEGMRRDGEGVDSFDWSQVHRAYDSGLRDLTRGLRTRLDLAAEAADTFDFLGRRVEADAEASWVHEARADFRAEFEETTRILPRGDGTPTRRMDYDDWRAQRHTLRSQLDNFRERWEARLRARVTEEQLRAGTEREVEARLGEWQRSTGRDPVEAVTVDTEAVVADHRADLTAEAERFLAGRHPRALTGQEWDAYAEWLRDTQDRLVRELPTRLEYQVGLERALAEADARFERLEADGPGAQRAHEGLREDVTHVFRELAGRGRFGEWGPDRVAAGEDLFFREYLPTLEPSLQDRLRFEWGMERALRDGGVTFHRLSGPRPEQRVQGEPTGLLDEPTGLRLSEPSGLRRGELTEQPERKYTVTEEVSDRLGRDFRDDWAGHYQDIYGPLGRDLRGWLQREQERGDAFGSTVREEWEADGAELQASRDAAARERAQAESRQWRQQVAANFRGMLGKGAVLEDLARKLEIPAGEIRSARVLAEYQRELSTLKSGFSQAWDTAVRTPSPDGEGRAPVVRAEEEARTAWQELAERTRAQDEAVQAWQRDPSWSLDLARMEITRTPSEESALGGGAGRTARGGEGDGQLQVQELAAREEQSAPESATATASAPPRSAGSRTDVPPAHAPSAEAPAGLRDTVEARDRAYGEFETRLAQFPELRSPQATGPVAVAREVFADAWAQDRTARGPAEVTAARGEALADLTTRLTSARAELVAREAVSEVFDREVATVVAPGTQHRAAFAGSQQAAALAQEFQQETAGQSSADPAELVREFRQRYAEAHSAWAAFDAALGGGTDGRVDLTDGQAQWNSPTRRWYSGQLALLRQQYVAEHTEATAVPDEAERRQRLQQLHDDVRHAALFQQRRAQTAVAENRSFAGRTARFAADPAWDRELTAWYEQQRGAITEPLAGKLDLYAPQAREQALTRFDAQMTALREVAEARHRTYQDFARLLDGRGEGTVTLSHAATVDWTRRHISDLRDAFAETVHAGQDTAQDTARAAEFVAPPSHAASDDWRVPAWQEAQRELHRQYADLLARAQSEAAQAQTAAGADAVDPNAVDQDAFDEAFAQWARDEAARGLSGEQLAAVHDRVHDDRTRFTAVGAEDRETALEELRDGFTVEAAREVARAHGEEAFERAFRNWGGRLIDAWRGRLDDGTQAPFELSLDLAEAVREQTAPDFHDRWDTALGIALDSVTDVRTGMSDAVRQATQQLRTLVGALDAEFDRHALLNGQLARLDAAFEEMTGSFRDRLDRRDRDLLATLDPENTEVSEPGRARVLDDARRTLREAFEEVFPTTDAAAGLTVGGGALPRVWQDRVRDLLAGLPTQLAHQAAREAEILRSQQDIANAVDTWAETGPGTGRTFLDRFPVSFDQVRPLLRRTLDVSVAAAVNDRFEQIFPPDRAGADAVGVQARLEGWRTAYDRLTDRDRLHTWLTVRHARDTVVATSGRLFDEQLDRWRAAHGDQTLSEADVARARAGLDERLLSAFDGLFTGRVTTREELTGAVRQWDALLADQARALPAHFAFESGVNAALHGAARSFGTLRADEDTAPDQWADLADDFRADFLAEYELLWAPEALSTSWADHEAAYDDAFTAGLTAGRPPGTHDMDTQRAGEEERHETPSSDLPGVTYDSPEDPWHQAAELLRPAVVIGRGGGEVRVRAAQEEALRRIMDTLERTGDRGQARALADRLAQETPGIRSAVPGLSAGASDIGRTVDPAPGPAPSVLTFQQELGRGFDLRRGSGLGGDPSAAAVARILGPDVYGQRQAPPAPEFLRGYDFTQLKAAQRTAFFAAVDMTRPVPRGDGVRPSALSRRPQSVIEAGRRSMGRATMLGLPKAVRVARLVHTIWLGGPLADEGAMGGFRRNIAALAASQPDFGVILWTDVSRAEFEAARATGKRPAGTSAVDRRLAEVLDMLDWARDAKVGLVNVDEIFSATSPMELEGIYKAETARRTGPAYAAASDILRVEILARFGGVYTDGDNVVSGDLSGEVRRVVDSDHGFGIMRHAGRASNAVMIAPAGHAFLDLLRDVVRGNYTRTPAENMVRALLLQNDEEVPDDRSVRRPLAPDVLNHTRQTVRDEVLMRTGPSPTVWRQLARRVGLPDTLDGLVFGSQEVFTLASAQSWLPPNPAERDEAAAAAAPPYDAQEALRVARGVLVTLVQGLHRQPGNLNLAQVAPVIRSQPRPDQMWDAVVGFIAGHPELRSLVRSVTFSTLGDSPLRPVDTVRLPRWSRRLVQTMPDAPRTGLGDHVLRARLLDPAEAGRDLLGRRDLSENVSERRQYRQTMPGGAPSRRLRGSGSGSTGRGAEAGSSSRRLPPVSGDGLMEELFGRTPAPEEVSRPQAAEALRGSVAAPIDVDAFVRSGGAEEQGEWRARPWASEARPQPFARPLWVQWPTPDQQGEIFEYLRGLGDGTGAVTLGAVADRVRDTLGLRLGRQQMERLQWDYQWASSAAVPSAGDGGRSTDTSATGPSGRRSGVGRRAAAQPVTERGPGSQSAAQPLAERGPGAQSFAKPPEPWRSRPWAVSAGHLPPALPDAVALSDQQKRELLANLRKRERDHRQRQLTFGQVADYVSTTFGQLLTLEAVERLQWDYLLRFPKRSENKMVRSAPDLTRDWTFLAARAFAATNQHLEIPGRTFVTDATGSRRDLGGALNELRGARSQLSRDAVNAWDALGMRWSTQDAMSAARAYLAGRNGTIVVPPPDADIRAVDIGHPAPFDLAAWIRAMRRTPRFTLEDSRQLRSAFGPDWSDWIAGKRQEELSRRNDEAAITGRPGGASEEAGPSVADVRMADPATDRDEGGTAHRADEVAPRGAELIAGRGAHAAPDMSGPDLALPGGGLSGFADTTSPVRPGETGRTGTRLLPDAGNSHVEPPPRLPVTAPVPPSLARSWKYVAAQRFFSANHHLETPLETWLPDASGTQRNLGRALYELRRTRSQLSRDVVNAWDALGMRWSTQDAMSAARAYLAGRNGTIVVPPPDADITAVDIGHPAPFDLAAWIRSMRHKNRLNDNERSDIRRAFGTAWGDWILAYQSGLLPDRGDAVTAAGVPGVSGVPGVPGVPGTAGDASAGTAPEAVGMATAARDTSTGEGGDVASLHGVLAPGGDELGDGRHMGADLDVPEPDTSPYFGGLGSLGAPAIGGSTDGAWEPGVGFDGAYLPPGQMDFTDPFAEGRPATGDALADPFGTFDPPPVWLGQADDMPYLDDWVASFQEGVSGIAGAGG